MKPNISPAIKGLVTAILMIAVAIAIFYGNPGQAMQLQYIIYLIYAAGIAWTLISYRRSEEYTGKFKDLFSQGFRCFIVVIILMVVFTYIFVKIHPHEFIDYATNYYRQELIKSKTVFANDVEPQVKNFRQQYMLRMVSAAIFGYLIIGAGITAVGSALLSLKRRQA